MMKTINSDSKCSWGHKHKKHQDTSLLNCRKPVIKSLKSIKRKKKSYYVQRNKGRKAANVSSETMHAGGQWDHIFKTWKEKTVDLEFYIWQKLRR